MSDDCEHIYDARSARPDGPATGACIKCGQPPSSSAAPVSFKPVARIRINTAGQISLTDMQGNYFDVSNHVGATLFVKETR